VWEAHEKVANGAHANLLIENLGTHLANARNKLYVTLQHTHR
jgi:hypothetical protein